MRNELIQRNWLIQSFLPALLLFSLCGLAEAQDQVTAIRATRVIDGVRSEPIDNGVVVVRGNEIVAVGSADEVEVPAGASVVDLPGHTLLPGLIDSHDHPTLRADSLELQPMIDQRMAPGGEQMVRAIRNMRISLLGGTTTVRVTGESSGIDFQLAKGDRRRCDSGASNHCRGHAHRGHQQRRRTAVAHRRRREHTEAHS